MLCLTLLLFSVFGFISPRHSPSLNRQFIAAVSKHFIHINCRGTHNCTTTTIGELEILLPRNNDRFVAFGIAVREYLAVKKADGILIYSLDNLSFPFLR
jgi:hypothetical protein